VRRATALLVLLAACGSDPEIERLVAALEAGRAEGRELRGIGPDKAESLEPVFALMERDDRRFVQLTCLEALLGAQAGADALPAVERALQSRDRAVSDLAALAHWRIAQTPNPGLALLLERASTLPVDRLALDALRRAAPIPEPLVADIVARAAPTPESLQLLAVLGPAARGALPKIEEAFASPIAGTRIAGAEAYALVSGDLSVAMDRLATECRPDNVFLRQRVLVAWKHLAEAQPAAAAVEFVRLLGDESAAVREICAFVLGGMQAGDADAALSRLTANDAAESVRRAAQEALRKRRE